MKTRTNLQKKISCSISNKEDFRESDHTLKHRKNQKKYLHAQYEKRIVLQKLILMNAQLMIIQMRVTGHVMTALSKQTLR